MSVEGYHAYSGQFSGLSETEVEARRKEYGLNALPARERPSRIAIFLSQFTNPLVYVILGAAVISLLLREFKDFYIIMAVVIFDAVLGYVQERQAEATYESLRKLVKPTATVVREGRRQEVDVTDLVPGDVVILTAGDRIPADGIVLESVRLAASEAILTGESESIRKDTTEGQNALYMGTTVLTGRGIMQVSRTGKDTELGKIATSLSETEDEATPLQLRLSAFSHTLTRIVIVITAILFFIGLAGGRPILEMARVAVILAIAAIPEGLLIAVTVILVIGMRRILKRQGLVKRLLAVETLGSVTTICTDKTGTLTYGVMTVSKADFPMPARGIEALVLCNNLEDSLEVALWDYAKANGIEDPEEFARTSKRIEEEPFSSEIRYMRTVNIVRGSEVAYVKGAPEVVTAMCGLSCDEKTKIQNTVERWADHGLKVLGIAVKEGGDFQALDGYSWAGLVGIEDPIRDEVIVSIRSCQKAGIKVKIITGDYERTAMSIARRLGLAVPSDGIISGETLAGMSDEELAVRAKEASVFARISPHQKLRIVSALQSSGEIVAMIGDGVNDAPALKKSNIGVAVGNASDVAKEASDLILLDSNFKTIVAAVEEGRVVFDNIKKVVSYTLSNSFAEILLIFGAMILKWPAPLTVAQILWIHLICDGPVDMVLGFEPAENGIMEEKPKPVSEPILGKLGMGLIAAISVTAAAACLGMFGHYLFIHEDIIVARSLCFETLAVISLVYVFAYRSMRKSIFHTGHFLSNKPLLASVAIGFVFAIGAILVPALRETLGLVTLSTLEWGMVFAVAFALLIIVEVGKLLAISHRR
jgi:Ca2+-transporting ATPase